MPTTSERWNLRAEAYTLRTRYGFTYQQIADRLGWSTASAASYAVKKWEERLNRATRRALNLNPFDRTFGVEIEVKGLSTYQAAAALERAGIACEDAGYTHRVMATWKAVTDASVSGGCEIVSPILRGEAGLAQVAQVMEALRAAGGRVDRSTGLHVHVGVSDLNGTGIARVLDFYATNQRAFDGLVSQSRRSDSSNVYCRGWGHGEKDNVVRGLKARETFQGAYVGGTRYYTINLQSLHRYGTVEFRQHQGTLNGTKATAWIRLLLVTVNEAAQMETPEVMADAQALVQRMGRHLESDNAATYLLGRAVTLASPSDGEETDNGWPY